MENSAIDPTHATNDSINDPTIWLLTFVDRKPQPTMPFARSLCAPPHPFFALMRQLPGVANQDNYQTPNGNDSHSGAVQI